MDIQKLTTADGQEVIRISGNGPLIVNAQSALDLIMTVQYKTGCSRLILPEKIFTEEFFSLKTGLAGEILQKFVNYHFKVAIIGDFSGYRSKSLADFIYESNKGRQVSFLPDEESALLWFQEN
ncbi:DUF4180 domain-containing protein [Christensenella hongkongensis]|uniref:DUF4180 domain-containing protein n=1 Tax=Christensenella hongkongensis TaxID=270498 RepID=UPI002672CD6A|nr:DUF4180 domain-containing protein [Christensenella hongkongensis]